MIGDKFYYNKDGVRKNGKFIYFWILSDFLKPIEGDFSSIEYQELDCSIFRFKNLKYQVYKNSMGEGRPRYSWTPTAEWEYPLPNSLREEMFEEICNYDSIELRLEKLKSMLNKELITEEEYNAKKQRKNQTRSNHDCSGWELPQT